MAFFAGASIRPRPFSRGNSSNADHRHNRRLGFNSATTFQPWKHGQNILMMKVLGQLQFGHDLSAVETQVACKVKEYRFLASIRPRPFSRGNCLFKFVNGILFLASIRPRPFSRGNYSWNNGSLTRMGCFNSATTFQPWKPRRQLGYFPLVCNASIRPRPFSRGNS